MQLYRVRGELHMDRIGAGGGSEVPQVGSLSVYGRWNKGCSVPR